MVYDCILSKYVRTLTSVVSQFYISYKEFCVGGSKPKTDIEPDKAII